MCDDLDAFIRMSNRKAEQKRGRDKKRLFCFTAYDYNIEIYLRKSGGISL